MCFDRDVAYTVHRQFIDGLAYQLPDYATAADAGCKMRSLVIEIPPGLPPGTYHYRVWAHMRVNPLREQRINYPELPDITILPRGE
jgi:hypothetical protein